MTRCPTCSTLLYRRVVAGVTLDGCPACGGVWTDKGELQTLGRDPVGLKMVDDAFPKGVQSADGGRTGKCPKCVDSALVEFEYATFRGLRMQRCKTCEGVFLDHGQAGEMASRLLPAVEPGSPAIEPSASPSPSVAARFGSSRTSPASPPGKAGPTSPMVRAPADPTSTASLPLVRGVAIGAYDRAPGFMSSVERGLRFIKGAYALALECPRLMIPLAIGTGVQLLVGGLVFGGMMLLDKSGQAMASDSSAKDFLKEGGIALALAGACFLFLTQLFNMAILGMTVSMVDAYLKGLAPDLRTAWRDVVKNSGGVVAMAVVSTIVSMLTSRDNRGRRGLLASFIDTAWTVLSFLLMPIIMIEDVGLMTAFHRAKEIHGRGLLQLGVGEVGLRAIAGLSAFLIIAPLAVVAFLVFPYGKIAAIVLVGVAVLCAVALGVLNAFARGAYYTCLYLWAVEVERAGDASQALVPAPLAMALIGP